MFQILLQHQVRYVYTSTFATLQELCLITLYKLNYHTHYGNYNPSHSCNHIPTNSGITYTLKQLTNQRTYIKMTCNNNTCL